MSQVDLNKSNKLANIPPLTNCQFRQSYLLHVNMASGTCGGGLVLQVDLN